MSQTASRAYRNTEVLTNSGGSACAIRNDSCESQGQERLAALILRAANLWQSEAHPQSVKCHKEEVAESQNAEVDLDDVSKQILKALTSVGQARPCDLSKYCGVSQPTIQRRLKALLLAKLIVKHGNTKGVTYALPKTEK
jgi:predicted HTH transcriptional regulator